MTMKTFSLLNLLLSQCFPTRPIRQLVLPPTLTLQRTLQHPHRHITLYILHIHLIRTLRLLLCHPHHLHLNLNPFRWIPLRRDNLRTESRIPFDTKEIFYLRFLSLVLSTFSSLYCCCCSLRCLRRAISEGSEPRSNECGMTSVLA